MNNTDIAREFATGLEDDDNFFELVRQRAALDDCGQAERLTQEVTLELAQCLPRDTARTLLSALPKSVEDYVFPKLPAVESEPRVGGGNPCSLARLERQVVDRWNVELEDAARYVGAVGLSVADRLSPIESTAVVMHLPLDLQRLLPPRGLAA